MKRAIKLRPQETDLPERKVRLRLPGRLALSLAEAARALGVSERHVREILPELPHVHLGPHFKDVEVRSIGLAEVQRFYDHCIDTGRPRSAKSIDMARNVLRLSLSHARGQGLVEADRVARIRRCAGGGLGRPPGGPSPRPCPRVRHRRP